MNRRHESSTMIAQTVALDTLTAERDRLRAELADEKALTMFVCNEFATTKNALEAENAELRKRAATLKISAVYWQKDGTAELTWEDIESGKRCEITVLVTPKQGERLSEVVWPCVYYGAQNATANATLNQLREAAQRSKSGFVDVLIIRAILNTENKT